MTHIFSVNWWTQWSSLSVLWLSVKSKNSTVSYFTNFQQCAEKFFVMVISRIKTGSFQPHDMSLQKKSWLHLFIRLLWFTVEEVVLFEHHACMTFSPTDHIALVEEQRPEKIQHRSTPTTQKVWQQIQIAKYPQITYSTFGSTNCGVSDLVRCDFWGGWGVFWSIKFQHFRTGLKLWKIISFYLIRQMG